MDKTSRNAETTTPPGKPSAAPPAIRRPSRLQTLGPAAAVVLVIVALAFFLRSEADIATDNAPGRAEPIVDASSSQPAPAEPPMAASAAQAAAETSIVKPRSKKTPAAKLDKDRTAKSAALPRQPIAPKKSTADAPAQADASTMPSESRAAADAPVSSSSDTLERAPVTITGCLEVSVDHSEFRLTDTEGTDAPKARSWRTGFLKKRSAPVALLEAPDPRGLEKQVGKRVAATGLLASNAMKVSSLQVVGSSCN